jgi:chromosome segregation ATPase
MHTEIAERIDTTIEAIKAVHDSAQDKISELDEQLKQLEEHKEYIHGIIHSLNRDVKKLESKPDPVIPIIPDIAPLRSEIKLVRTVIDEIVISHHGEMNELWKGLQEIHIVRKDLLDRVEAIKIPDVRPLYYLFGVAVLLAGIALYV